MKKLLLITLSLSVCAAAGCSFMSPQRDHTQYFILSSVAGNASAGVAAASQASTSQLSIGLGPITFPDYLKTPWMVTRAASNRLMVSDQNRWGEPVDRNFASVLYQNLAQMLGTRRISMYPWYADTHVDYQVKVWVERFEPTEGGGTQLSAYWIIINGQDGKQLAVGQTFAKAAAQGGEDPAGALSDDLATMSRQIADRIAALSATPGNPGGTLRSKQSVVQQFPR